MLYEEEPHPTQNRATCGFREPPSCSVVGQATLAQLAGAGMTPQATRAPPPPSAAGMSE